MGYYNGDFYRGDPGFVSWATRWGSKLGKFVGPMIGLGGAGGPAAEGAIVKVGRAAGGRIMQAGRVLAKHPVMTAAGAAGAIGAVGTMSRGGGVMPGGGGGANGMLRGYHISKRTGAMVRNRRMRVTNPRALRRAIRRANGFARLAKRVLHFTSPRAHKGRAVFKFRRKRK